MIQAKNLLFWGAICFFLIPRAHAFNLTVEPIVGYERVQQVLPSRHFVNRLFYGARVTAGILLLSAESEYTHGQIQETYPTSSVNHTGDRLKLGLRSGFRLAGLLSMHARGGVQASREKTETTVSGVTTTTYQPLTTNPYAGLGARAWLGRTFTASADVVAIIPTINDFSQNEYIVTAGFGIRLP